MLCASSREQNCKTMRNKIIYILLVCLITTFVMADYVPGGHALAACVTPPVALFAGLVFALGLGEAYPRFNKLMSKYLLQYSVVGLGFGMNLHSAIKSGSDGMLFTIASVAGTLAIGVWLGIKVFKAERDTSYLISSGTAICGGSAIAAVGPVMRAKDCDMSVALATVFVLNAIALFIFPPMGHSLGLSPHQFGTWSAIAIHDTSSVVGAAQAYGEEALEIATTIKLTRALWIVPLTLFTAWFFKAKGRRFSVPLFIIFFIVALVVNTYFIEGTSLQPVGEAVNGLARKCLTITMFFIGAALSRATLRRVGLRPMLLGIALWVIISGASLAYILLAVD